MIHSRTFCTCHVSCAHLVLTLHRFRVSRAHLVLTLHRFRLCRVDTLQARRAKNPGLPNDLDRAKQRLNPHKKTRRGDRLDDEAEDYRHMPTIRKFTNQKDSGPKGLFGAETIEWRLLDEVADMDLEEFEGGI